MEPPVLIVGGGIAGLTLATALHRRGIPAEIVERRPAWPTEGAAITLHANGVRVLRSLGLGGALDRVSEGLAGWTFCDEHAEPLCRTDLEELWGEATPCRGVTRVRLQQVLLAGAAEVPHRLGVAVVGLAQEHGRASVAFSDGSRGEYGLVVGADGIRSTVRRLAVSSAEPRYAGTMTWRSVIPARPAGVSELMILMGDGRFFGLVPVGDGQTYGFAGLEADRFPDPTPGRLDRFRRRFAGFGAPVGDYLDHLVHDDDLHAAPAEWVEIDTWHDGRVVLVGDAAHAAPPHMGEGGGLAMEDAVVLAECLQAADDMASALDAYTARRRPRVDWVRNQSLVAASAWLLPPAVRNTALRERGDEMLRDRYHPLVSAP